MLNPDGRLGSKWSRATGWRIYDDKNLKTVNTNANNEKSTNDNNSINNVVQEKVTSIFELLNIKPIVSDLKIEPGKISTTVTSLPEPITGVTIDGRFRRITFGRNNSVNFDFANIGNPGVSAVNGQITGTFNLQNLNRNQQNNLNNIANFLNSFPNSIVTFNFPDTQGLPFSSYRGAVNDMYRQCFNQIRNFLNAGGVSNNQIRMTQSGRGFNANIR